MRQFQFRNGFEEGTTNIYAIALQCTLDYEVEVLVDQAWVAAKSLSSIAALLSSEATMSSHIVAGGDPLYISETMAAIV